MDIQKFAEDETTAEVNETQDETAQESEPIPSELDGLPEDIAREAMAEAAELEQTEESTPIESTTPQTYTYEQYKAKDDELTALKAQFEEYRRKVETPQTPPVRAQPQVQPTPKINAAMLEEMKSLIEQRALEMTGLTKEDLASFEFAEDGDDKRVETFNIAKDMAKSEILTAIQQAQANQMIQHQRMIQQRDANVKSYNEFATKAMAEPDFQQIQQYAINDYFNQLDANEQLAVSGAYYRIEKNTAEATDIALIKNYYRNAAASYRKQNKSAKSVKNKIEQANKLPKVDQLNGTTAAGEISITELERMLNDKPFEEIPQKYQDKLLGK